MDLKAQVIITCTMTDKILEYVKTKITTFKMVKTLDAKYAAKSTPMQIIYRGK